MKSVKGFKNCHGEEYHDLRNINFDNLKEMSSNFGSFVAETSYSDDPFFTTEFKIENGVYIYKTTYDKKKALRIYKDFADYKYTYYSDDYLVNMLVKKQKGVYLTEFPTGIVSIENKVIGQEIPYYENYKTICQVVTEKKHIKKLTMFTLKILKILLELEKNYIVYSDIHSKNFMVDLANDTIKLIDFEKAYLAFDDDVQYLYERMIKNLKRMIYGLSKYSGMDLNEMFFKTNTLKEIEESLMESNYSLSKKLD